MIDYRTNFVGDKSSTPWRQFYIPKLVMRAPMSPKTIELLNLVIPYQNTPDGAKPYFIKVLEDLLAYGQSGGSATENYRRFVTYVQPRLAEIGDQLSREKSRTDVNSLFRKVGKALQNEGILPTDLEFGFITAKVVGSSDPNLIDSRTIAEMLRKAPSEKWPEDLKRITRLVRGRDGIYRYEVHVTESAYYVIDTDGDNLPVLVTYSRDENNQIKPHRGISLKSPVTAYNQQLTFADSVDRLDNSIYTGFQPTSSVNFSGKSIINEILEKVYKERKASPHTKATQFLGSLETGSVGLLTNRAYVKEVFEAFKDLALTEEGQRLLDSKDFRKIGEHLSQKIIDREFRFGAIELEALKAGTNPDLKYRPILENFDRLLPKWWEEITLKAFKGQNASVRDKVERLTMLFEEAERRGIDFSSTTIEAMIGSATLDDFGTLETDKYGKVVRKKNFGFSAPTPKTNNYLLNRLQRLGLIEEMGIEKVERGLGKLGVRTSSVFLRKGITGDILSEAGLDISGDKTIYRGNVISSALRLDPETQSYRLMSPEQLLRERFDEIDPKVTVKLGNQSHLTEFGRATGIFSPERAVSDNLLLNKMAESFAQMDPKAQGKLFGIINNQESLSIRSIKDKLKLIAGNQSRDNIDRWVDIITFYQLRETGIEKEINRVLDKFYSDYGQQTQVNIEKGVATISETAGKAIRDSLEIDMGREYFEDSFSKKAQRSFKLVEKLLKSAGSEIKGLLPHARRRNSTRVWTGLLDSPDAAFIPAKAVVKGHSQLITGLDLPDTWVAFADVDEARLLNERHGFNITNQALEDYYATVDLNAGPGMGSGIAFTESDWDRKIREIREQRGVLGAVYQGPLDEDGNPMDTSRKYKRRETIDTKGNKKISWIVDETVPSDTPKILLGEGGPLRINPIYTSHRAAAGGEDIGLLLTTTELKKRGLIGSIIERNLSPEQIKALWGMDPQAQYSYLAEVLPDYFKYDTLKITGEAGETLAELPTFMAKLQTAVADTPVENLLTDMEDNLDKTKFRKEPLVGKVKQDIIEHFTQVARDFSGGPVDEEKIRSITNSILDNSELVRGQQLDAIAEVLRTLNVLPESTVQKVNQRNVEVQKVMGRLAGTAEAMGGHIGGKTASHLNAAKYIVPAGVVAAGLIIHQQNKRRPEKRRR
jgi:hypothetical protein